MKGDVCQNIKLNLQVQEQNILKLNKGVGIDAAVKKELIQVE